MSQASHNQPPAASRPRLIPELGLVDLADTTLEERLAGKLNEQLELFACRMRQGLLAASVAIGLEVMDELIDAEVTDAAGPKGKHDPDRSAYRHGTEAGKVTLGGRRVPVVRPRVRTVADDENGQDHEVRLESYDTFAKVDLLAGHMVECLMAGLSGRRYEAALEPVGSEIEQTASGTKQSSVSRRFVTVTGERLAEFRTRPLDAQRWLVCFIDGFDFAEHTMVGALGVTADGTKVPTLKVPADPVAAGKPVTLRELLTHTAGITAHGFPGYASTELVPTLVQVLNGEKPANTPPIRSESAPGAGWKYSGGGYIIMQQTLIDLTKEPFPKLLHDTVLAPIGMTHSTYEQPLPKEFQDFAATPYRGDGKPVEGGAHTYPETLVSG